MLRATLERTTGPLTDDQFIEVMDLTTTDICINNIAWGRRTSLGEAVQIAEITFRMLQRCRVA